MVSTYEGNKYINLESFSIFEGHYLTYYGVVLEFLRAFVQF